MTLVESALDRVVVEMGEEIRSAVLAHGVATAAPTVRVEVAQSWAAALRVCPSTHPRYTIAFLPGATCDQALAFVVHRPTGAVMGGTCALTGRRWRESDADWFARLDVTDWAHAAIPVARTWVG